VALPALRLLVSSDNWLWTAGRDELLIFAADASTAKVSLLQQASSPDLGPLAAVALTFVPDSDIAEAAARHGQRNLTLENLRRDIQPLFAGDSWLSQWILSVVEAIRALDEKELRAMTAFIDTDESTRHYATAFLLMLKDEPQQPAAEAVMRAINVLWHLGLNDALKNRLNKIAPLVEIAQRPDAPGAPIPAPPEPSLKEYLKALGSGIEKR
jgi:hypothetical protein